MSFSRAASRLATSLRNDTAITLLCSAAAPKSIVSVLSAVESLYCVSVLLPRGTESYYAFTLSVQVLDDTAAASALLFTDDEIVSDEILNEFFVDEISFDAVTCVHENSTETLQPEGFTTA
ncbi:unnamed protein product [Trichogramma brassicae]|uniref:Uncharacterized protein n=1 Tax=Trichogramma brassicae TaxID=86971 RepID=A0A6H5IJV4_9HYME|nr:unnamed protein product [Trichogramma brassicae]